MVAQWNELENEMNGEGEEKIEVAGNGGTQRGKGDGVGGRGWRRKRVDRGSDEVAEIDFAWQRYSAS